MSEPEQGERRGGREDIEGAGVSAAERQRVVDALCEHFADDRLEVDEFERRLDRAHAASAPAELRAVLAGLPGTEGGEARRAPAGDRGSGGGRTEPSGDRAIARDPAPRPPDDRPRRAPVESAPAGRIQRAPAFRVSDSQLEFAFWSGRKRSGSWVPARTIRVVACMGGVELDFRRAAFGVDEVELDVIAFMGGVEIVVPPGLHVETAGLALLGGFDENREDVGPVDAGAPTLRITGFVLMGGVEVVCRPPDDSLPEGRT